MPLFASKSILDYTTSDDNNILHLEVDNLIRADHSDITKTGRDCLYFKLSYKKNCNILHY